MHGRLGVWLAVDTNFVYDYALVFSTPNNGPAIRIDMTIIPKVYRNGGKYSAFLCRPDAQDTQFNISTAVRDYIPRTGDCGAAGRAKPYAAMSSDYATAHPEEAAWLQGRLDNTAREVQKFVQNKAGLSLNLTQSRLKIAVVHSGGGKRAMLHSLGTLEREATVFEPHRAIALMPCTLHILTHSRRGPGLDRLGHLRARVVECGRVGWGVVCPGAHIAEQR